MNEEDINKKIEKEKIEVGRKIVELLNLEPSKEYKHIKEPMFDTAYGPKTFLGLAQAVTDLQVSSWKNSFRYREMKRKLKGRERRPFHRKEDVEMAKLQNEWIESELLSLRHIRSKEGLTEKEAEHYMELLEIQKKLLKYGR
ncbi:MAG: hypothetical protein V7670_06465 [Maribacter arcticus]|uniref:hypothetical protein n=1 Tax=Maribacter arcticus TaxID=561365 RepID=UPI0030012F7C